LERISLLGSPQLQTPLSKSSTTNTVFEQFYSHSHTSHILQETYIAHTQLPNPCTRIR